MTASSMWCRSPSASSIMDPLLGEDANKGVLAHSYIDMAEGNPLGIITIEDVIEEVRSPRMTGPMCR